jgi:catechol 2,3-dioxygenase-like lactoylglutathione lyase family enzyme
VASVAKIWPRPALREARVHSASAWHVVCTARGPESVAQSLRATKEDTMSTQTRSDERGRTSPAGTVEWKLEVVVLPVSDVDRAKRFYGGLGWRLDADFSAGEDFRVVQMTPPGSACSIHFGTGVTTAAPGSIQNLYLVVFDIEAARAELVGRGVDVGEVFHHDGARRRVPGRDPEGRSYSTFARFGDPDGNTWLLQEIQTRLPGRE